MISADVNAKQECTVEDLFQLNLPKAKGSRDKVFCKLNANNKNIELEIDTGSPVKLINVDDAKKYFPKERVKTTDTELYKGTGKIVGHQAKLYLKNNVPPKFVKASRVPFPLLKAVEDEIAGQVQEGILVKVDTSEWATPIVAVPKRGGAVRICGDYKVTLKPALVVDEHLLPTIDELFSAMADGEKFSKIDMSNAYLQPEVHPDDQHLLTLSTHKGLYKPTRLMFGVPCAPSKWQRFMELTLSDLPGVTVFLDDIKITAINDETHLQRIEDVLRRLNEHNMRINLKKSDFLRDRMEYCGYEIDKTGIRKLRNKVLAIQNMKPPTTKDELRAVLGLINYYGRFVQNLGDIVYPLNMLLRQNVPFKFTARCVEAFEKIKTLIQSDTILTHYNPKLPLVLAVDASPTGPVDGRIWKHHVDQIRKVGEDLNRGTLIEVLPPEETEGANSVMKNSPEPSVMKNLPETQQSLQTTKTDSTEVVKSQQEQQQTTEPIKTTTTVGDD
ncbi:PREDICTED: uncharacterized protein K02A2.6-like, partial [Rhagoletis zephyria]|uniref:uncharacterized protein K02A2.6-like n=1 Tax=Rhagoletis zephyria TaxID=28612 RepID=UPI000811666C